MLRTGVADTCGHMCGTCGNRCGKLADIHVESATSVAETVVENLRASAERSAEGMLQ